MLAYLTPHLKGHICRLRKQKELNLSCSERLSDISQRKALFSFFITKSNSEAIKVFCGIDPLGAPVLLKPLFIKKTPLPLLFYIYPDFNKEF